MRIYSVTSWVVSVKFLPQILQNWWILLRGFYWNERTKCLWEREARWRAIGPSLPEWDTLCCPCRDLWKFVTGWSGGWLLGTVDLLLVLLHWLIYLSRLFYTALVLTLRTVTRSYACFECSSVYERLTLTKLSVILVQKLHNMLNTLF